MKEWIYKFITRNNLLVFSLVASFSANGQLITEPDKWIPVGVDKITIFVPQLQCTNGNVCVSWAGYASVKIAASFSPADPQFDVNLEENKVNRLSFLSIYSASTDPLILQCQNATGQWQTVQSSSGESATSVVGAKDANDIPINFNVGSGSTPVFEQRWPGGLVVNSSNCLVNTVVVSTTATTDWAYKRYKKSASFRAVRASGAAVNMLPLSQEACRLGDVSPNLWQRSLNCIGGANVQISLDFDEYFERSSNYGSISFTLNTGSSDQWACNYKVFLDEQPLGVNAQGVQQVFGRSTTNNYSNNRVSKGAHILKLVRDGLTCYPTGRNCPLPSSCVHNTNVVHWSTGIPGDSSGAQRTDGAAEQVFSFTVN